MHDRVLEMLTECVKKKSPKNKNYNQDFSINGKSAVEG